MMARRLYKHFYKLPNIEFHVPELEIFKHHLKDMEECFLVTSILLLLNSVSNEIKMCTYSTCRSSPQLFSTIAQLSHYASLSSHRNSVVISPILFPEYEQKYSLYLQNFQNRLMKMNGE